MTTDAPLFVTESLPAQRPTLENLRVGSAVLVLEAVYRRHAGLTSPRPGVVTKRARVWITVALLEVRRFPHEYRFRLDDQSDGADSYQTRFRTPEQYAWDQVQETAFVYLKEQQIHVSSYTPWRHRLVELARAVWQLEHPEEVHG